MPEGKEINILRKTAHQVDFIYKQNFKVNYRN